MTLFTEGAVINQTYEVERFLGEGAFAEVYRVKHRFLGRQAMKVFKNFGVTMEEVERMLSEAILLSRIGHPNIVRVFDANVTDSDKGMCGYFTMENVPGGSLERFWRSFGLQFIPVDTAVEIARQVCRGLAVAHAQTPPIIHRDIKPQNILIGYDDSGELRAKVGDFGLAREVNPLTLLASARGTPYFKPPEVYQDVTRDSPAGDVWAIGVTLYLLLTERFPYLESIDSTSGINLDEFSKPLIPPCKFNARVNASLERIVMRTLKTDPTHRYSNVFPLLEDLEAWTPQKGDERKILDDRLSGSSTKDIYGDISPLNEEEAKKMADQALHLARQSMRLGEAADLLEEALTKWPGLREKYEYHIKLWRRGMTL